jgi:hypothetical protein
MMGVLTYMRHTLWRQ